jgi:hypothetical protein
VLGQHGRLYFQVLQAPIPTVVRSKIWSEGIQYNAKLLFDFNLRHCTMLSQTPFKKMSHGSMNITGNVSTEVSLYLGMF